MSKRIIDLGTVANDHTGTKIRVGGDYINKNFTEVYNGYQSFVDINAIPLSDDDDLYGHEGHIYIKRGTGRTFLLFI
mgnify:FL=1